MTKNEFAARVRVGARNISPVAVEGAIDHHHRIGKFRLSDIPNAVALARHIEGLGTLQEEAAGKKSFNTLPASAEAIAISILLAEKLRPDVENLRVQLFGGSDPPFPDYEDAIDWIEEECDKGRPELSADEASRYENEYNKELNALADRWDATFGYREILQPKRPGFKYAHLGLRRVIKVPYWSKSRIGPLHYFVEQTSNRTGFPEEALVAYVLSGIEPTIPELSMSWSTTRLSDRPPEVTVTFRKTNIRELDFRNAYGFLKERVGGARPSPLKAKDLAIIRAIRALGGIPAVGKGRFWIQVQERLVSEGITDLGPDGVRVRFMRLKKKGVGSDLLALLGA